MEAEQFINQIFNSASEIIKVVPSDGLFFKIENQIILKKRVSARTILVCTTAVAALLMVNIVAISIKNKSNDNEMRAISNQIYVSNQLYN